MVEEQLGKIGFSVHEAERLFAYNDNGECDASGPHTAHLLVLTQKVAPLPSIKHRAAPSIMVPIANAEMRMTPNGLRTKPFKTNDATAANDIVFTAFDLYREYYKLTPATECLFLNGRSMRTQKYIESLCKEAGLLRIITCEDKCMVDDLEYCGGEFYNSITVPSGQSFDVYWLPDAEEWLAITYDEIVDKVDLPQYGSNARFLNGQLHRYDYYFSSAPDAEMLNAAFMAQCVASTLYYVPETFVCKACGTTIHWLDNPYNTKAQLNLFELELCDFCGKHLVNSVIY